MFTINPDVIAYCKYLYLANSMEKWFWMSYFYNVCAFGIPLFPLLFLHPSPLSLPRWSHPHCFPVCLSTCSAFFWGWTTKLVSLLPGNKCVIAVFVFRLIRGGMWVIVAHVSECVWLMQSMLFRECVSCLQWNAEACVWMCVLLLPALSWCRFMLCLYS